MFCTTFVKKFLQPFSCLFIWVSPIAFWHIEQFFIKFSCTLFWWFFRLAFIVNLLSHTSHEYILWLCTFWMCFCTYVNLLNTFCQYWQDTGLLVCKFICTFSFVADVLSWPQVSQIIVNNFKIFHNFAWVPGRKNTFN